MFLIRTTWETFGEPTILAEDWSETLLDSVFGWIKDPNLSDLADELGSAGEDLIDYVTRILNDLEEHYDSLYETYLNGADREELIAKIVQQILNEF